MAKPENPQLFVFSGDKVDVHWDQRLCLHVGECVRAEGDLFVGGRKPWCEPGAADVPEVLDVIRRCPSGALSVHSESQPKEQPASRNTVSVANNGPLYVQGELEVDGAEADMAGVQFRAALCRCGQSQRKPFCDNSHESSGFTDRGAVGARGTTLEDEGGTLTIKRAQDGPLLLSGPFSILTPNGRVAWQGTKAALCRCGSSGNKPFCDGSHAKVGFEAP